MSERRMGEMWIARCRSCGKLTAMSWADRSDPKDEAKSVSRWVRRGDDVSKIERFVGDPMPEFCDCRSLSKASKALKKSIVEALTK